MAFFSSGMTQLLLLAFLGYFVAWLVYCRYLHPLHRIPGPFLASWSSAWIVYHAWRGDMARVQLQLHRKHGHLVRVAPNEISCSDPAALDTIYGPRTKYTKTEFYDVWGPTPHEWKGHFATRDPRLHAERRRKVHNIYSMSSVLESEPAIDECTQLLCTTLAETSRQPAPVDITEWTNLYALDVLGALFFGQRFGCLAERRDVGGYIASVAALVPMMTVAGTVPSYLQSLYLLFTVVLSPSRRGAISTFKSLECAADAAIVRRTEQLAAAVAAGTSAGAADCDLLRKILSLYEGKDACIDRHQVLVEATTSIFAGADTTSIALDSILYHTLRTPHAHAALRHEIDRALAAGTITLPIPYAQAIKLPYLSACINEGLRMHPSVGLTMPRYVPAGGAYISGAYIPAGYRIGINAAVVHYDYKIFGADADEFRPERWLDPDADTAAMHRTMFTFGAGARTCIGKNIPLSEIYKLIPHLVAEFDLRLAAPERPWTTHNYWFDKPHDVPVFFK